MTLQTALPGIEGGLRDFRVVAGHSSAAARSCDSTLELFIRSALPEEDAHQVLKGFYTDALHRTLLARLAGLRGLEEKAKPGRVKPLPKWRLKRVCEFVESNLDRRIPLQLLARVSGVSRMYFAAQFRAATNLSPHNYVLQRKLAQAERLLADTDDSIVNIALGVGFQTQSHFTTAFKRAKGLTPNRWRELHAGRSSAASETQLCISETRAAVRKDGSVLQAR
jgi:AraC family transcriptional regulator